MCDDLIYAHYLHAGSSSTLLRAFGSGNPHWIVHNPPAEDHTWLILRASEHSLYDLLDVQFSREHSITKNWTISSFREEIVPWAVKEQRGAKMLYEMKLDLRKDIAEEERSGYGLNTYFNKTGGDDDFCCTILHEELESKNTMTLETGFFSRHPSRQRYVEKGGEMFMELMDQDRLTPAGYVTVLRDTKSSPTRLYISSFFLEQKYRGKGMGKWFMKNIIARALGNFLEPEELTQGRKDWKSDEVWLTVFCTNVVAVNLYASLGFRVNRCLWMVWNEEKSNY